MAERRMFAKTIIDSDAFLDMPLSSQALYFHLSMRADDEGFINNPRKIVRMVNASNNDMDILTAKKFIIPFDSGVVVIKHWKIHNYIRGDRFHATKYEEERSQLTEKDNGAYTRVSVGIPSDNQLGDKRETEVRLGKVRLGKVNNRGTFVPPTLDQVTAYVEERGGKIDPERFINYYTMTGWKVSGGRGKMKDWKAAVRNWEKMEEERNQKKTRISDIDERKNDYKQILTDLPDPLEEEE